MHPRSRRASSLPTRWAPRSSSAPRISLPDLRSADARAGCTVLPEVDGAHVARFSRRVKSSKVMAAGRPSASRCWYVSASFRDSVEVGVGGCALWDVLRDVDDDACAGSSDLVAPLPLAVLPLFMVTGLQV